MPRLLVVSDPHFAAPAEQARRGHEGAVIRSRFLRALAHAYRHWIWLRNPYDQNHLLQSALDQAPPASLTIANGDYTIDTGFVGVADDAALESARLCLDTLRSHSGHQLETVIGDHELGKMSLFGGVGGPRLLSWQRCRERLSLQPLWHREFNGWHLIGLTSTLVALPLFDGELLPAEAEAWYQLRESHLDAVQRCFDAVPRNSHPTILLFCHDPSALPFLQECPSIQARLPEIATTVVGHLHSTAIFNTGRRLAGMPPIHFLGTTARRLSRALNRAKAWSTFKTTLCPSLAGIELLKDGGYLTIELETPGQSHPRIHRHRLRRTSGAPAP